MQYRNRSVGGVILAIVLALTSTYAFGGGTHEDSASITLYSGRGESLVAPLIERFEQETGITVDVRYGGTSELAVLLQEEGDRSPADLFWAQDGGALGAVARAGLLSRLPDDLLADLPDIYRNDTGEWVATSGRARVLVYHPDRVSDDELPSSVFELTDSQYAGRVGWAPTNGSFQSFVTAMRVLHGDGTTGEWLEGMVANDSQAFRNNTAIVEGVAAGEADMGIVNHYYLLRMLDDDPDLPLGQVFFDEGDVGNLVNVAGIGIVATASNHYGAQAFIRFLLDLESQQYFTDEVFEYPITDEVVQNPELESFARLLEVSPALNLDDLDDLDGTLDLLRSAGAL